MECEDDSHRHDGRARPAREPIDVEGRPLRQQHHVRGHGGCPFPVPLAEESEPYLREYARLGHSALGEDEGSRSRHVGSVGRVAGKFEREVTFDGRAQVSGRAIVHPPGAVRRLPAPDVFRDAGDAVTFVRPHEVREHDVLRFHGWVGLQLPPPVAILVLSAEEVLLRPLQRPANAVFHAGHEIISLVTGRAPEGWFVQPSAGRGTLRGISMRGEGSFSLQTDVTSLGVRAPTPAGLRPQ